MQPKREMTQAVNLTFLDGYVDNALGSITSALPDLQFASVQPFRKTDRYTAKSQVQAELFGMPIRMGLYVLRSGEGTTLYSDEKPLASVVMAIGAVAGNEWIRAISSLRSDTVKGRLVLGSPQGQFVDYLENGNCENLRVRRAVLVRRNKSNPYVGTVVAPRTPIQKPLAHIVGVFPAFTREQVAALTAYGAPIARPQAQTSRFSYQGFFESSKGL